MRTLFDVLKDLSNAAQVAALKFIVSTSCIRAFYACLFEKQEMSQAWVDVEAKARGMLMPRCKTPFDVPQAPSELLDLVITNKLRVVPMEFLKAQADEINVNVEDLVRLNQSLQGMEQDELLAYSEAVLQEYLGLIPQEVEFEAIPLKVWLVLGEKALQAVEYEKQQVMKWASIKYSPTDLAAIQLFNGDILKIQEWISGLE